MSDYPDTDVRRVSPEYNRAIGEESGHMSGLCVGGLPLYRGRSRWKSRGNQGGATQAGRRPFRNRGAKVSPEKGGRSQVPEPPAPNLGGYLLTALLYIILFPEYLEPICKI